MPYYKSSEEWLDRSAALLEARPSTTRITTKFSIKPVKLRKKAAAAGETTTTDDDASAATEPKPPRGSLVLKTYDPVSGVALKYRTTKAAEVSRLIQSSLARLGRGMAGMPDVPEETMADVPAEGATGTTTQDTKAGGAGAAQQQQQGQPGGGGKKKKRGKK